MGAYDRLYIPFCLYKNAVNYWDYFHYIRVYIPCCLYKNLPNRIIDADLNIFTLHSAYIKTVTSDVTENLKLSLHSILLI